jgi:antitoxin component YwqK of YwqJK toxin-antitoxin module
MRHCLPILASALLLSGCEKTATHFHPNGKKSEVFKYRLQPNPATGKPDTVRWGETTEWREDGSLSSRLNYEAGKPDGPAFDFYNTGEVRVQYYYRSGKLDSGIYFMPNAKIWQKIVAGAERDTFITYDSLGNAEKHLRPDPMD